MRAPERLAMLMTLLMGFSLVGLAGWRMLQSYDQVFHDGLVTTRKLASSLAFHAEATIQAADIVLSGLTERLKADGDSGNGLSRLHSLLLSRVTEVRTIHHLVVFSAEGDALTASFDPMPAMNVSDRAYFKFHQANPGPDHLIGPLVRSRLDGRWSLTVSRRYDREDGSFGGVVVAVINRDTFSDFYGQLSVGDHGSVTLVGDDQAVVARYPPLGDPDALTRPVTQEAWFQEETGSGRRISRLDGVARLYSYKRVKNTPMTVVVSLAEDDVLAAWRSDSETTLITCAVISVALGLLGWRLANQIRQRAEREAVIRESEEQYRLIAHHSTDVIVRLGSDYRLQYVSPASERLLGYLPSELLDVHLKDTVNLDDWPTVEENLHEISSLGHAPPAIYQSRRKDGETVWVEAVGQGLVDGRGFILTLRDITLRQKAEQLLHTSNNRLHVANLKLERLATHLTTARDQAEQGSRAKSRFLAGISHELRTPLNGVLGYAHLLRIDGKLDSVQTNRVNSMIEAGAHLLEMINRVLDLSEIEADQAELQLTKIDPSDVARACHDLMRPAAAEKKLALDISIEEGVPDIIVTDATRLRQVLLNLLGNAVKFTTNGSVVLRVSPSQNGAMVRFEVADTGPGIPPERRNRLFQEFDRLDADVNRNVEGAGLGLALSAKLALLIGGTLCHEDNLGGGSLFWLELPLTAGKNVTPIPTSLPIKRPLAAPVAVTIPAHQLRVLVVDDIAMNRDIAASILRSAGHKVVCAESGEEAVAAAGAAVFEVILMDVRMPKVDGLEAARRIRMLPSPRGRVPIVALTAQAFNEQIEECLGAGMDSHLAKPFTPAALLDAVARAANSRRLKDQLSVAVAG